MTCFGGVGLFCGDPERREATKQGAFYECHHHRNDDDDQYYHHPEERKRAMIPWVWSRKFGDNYHMGKILGKGSFACVYEGTRLDYPHESFAVKVVQRNFVSRKQLVAFKDEVQILADIQHENIVQLVELYKEPRNFFVVMEKLNGGELFDRLVDIQTYSEMDARGIMQVIFEAVSYCHCQNVAHRDLKPENLLLKDVNDVRTIRLADFGFAKLVEKPESLNTLCGSPLYTAPEVINYKPYDQRVDNWSLGVILFAVLGGYPPFYKPTTRETFQQIRQVDYHFHPEYWSGVSPDAKNLIASLLTLDPRKRISAAEALDHAWMTGRGEDLSNNSLVDNLHLLRKFNEERKKAANSLRGVSFYWLVSRR